MTSLLEVYLQGALLLAYLVIGVIFLRYWRVSRDRFFIWFAAAFLMFAFATTLRAFGSITSDHAYYVYVPRVVGFLLILSAILDKNRRDG